MKPIRVVIVSIFVLAGVAACSSFYVPRYFEAAWFLEDVAAGAGPSTWKTLHNEPTRETTAWSANGRASSGDLYRPQAERVKGRILFLPGLAPGGKDDARVVAFATTLARAGWAAFVPDMASIRELRASPDDVGYVADAVTWLSGADVGAPPSRVGIASLSYMSGPAILAAARADVADKVSFLFSIGGYHDVTAMIRFVTTRAYRASPGDPWSYAPPADYATWTFLKANAEGVDDPADRALLIRIAEAKLAEELGEAPKGGFDAAAASEGLKADGRAVFALIANRDPEKVPALIDALPPRLRDAIAKLDPSRADLSGLRAELLLVHGEDDPMIPATESEALDARFGSGAHLYVLEQVTHVEVNRPASFWDQLDMLFAARRLLSYRE